MNENKPFEAPPAAPFNSRKKPVRWWRIFFIFATPIFLISSAVGLFRIGYTIREVNGRMAMAAELERLSSEGFAIDNETTDQLYRSRTSDEYVDEWLEVFAYLDSQEFIESFEGVPMFDKTIDDEQPFESAHSRDWKYAEICSKLVSNNQELLDQMRRLAAEPTAARFPIHFQSIETLLPEVQSLRQVALLLFIDANVAIHTKERDRVVRDIVALYGLTKHADAVPFVVSRLVGISLRRLALDTLKQCIEIDLLQDEQLRSIDEQLQNYCDIGNRWREITSEELGIDLPMFVRPAEGVPARGYDALYFIGLIRRAMEFQTEDWTELNRSVGELESDLKVDAGFVLNRMDHMLTHLVFPGLHGLSSACINDAQSHRLGRLAIGIRLCAHQTRSLPADLAALSNLTTQLHPAGSKHFGYKLTSEGAVLWGFEFNGKTAETPDSPPETDLSAPNANDNARWIWKLAQ